MKELFELFITFLKIGGFTFGGGLAMLPVIRKEVVEVRGWITDVEILDCFAASQCLPGVLAVNTATFIGYRRKGIAGAFFSTLGMVLPSIVIILIIAAFIQNFSELAVVKSAFAGIRIVVAVFVVNVVVMLWKSSVVDKVCAAICVLSFAACAFLDISPVLVIIFAALAGVTARSLGGRT